MHHFVTEMCTHVCIFLLQSGALWEWKVVHCEIWDWCIVRFAQPIYQTVSKFDKSDEHIPYQYSSTGWFGTLKCFLFICIPLCHPLAMSGLSSLGVLYPVNPDPRRGPHLLVIWIDGAPRVTAGVGLEFGEKFAPWCMTLKSYGNVLLMSVSLCQKMISHNVPFYSRNVHRCAHFCYNMVHCEICDWRIVRFIQLVYHTVSKFDD